MLITPGYHDVKITVETSGGHSSVPPDHSGIGILSQIISAVEAKPYEPELTPINRTRFPVFTRTITDCPSILHHPPMWRRIRPRYKPSATQRYYQVS